MTHTLRAPSPFPPPHHHLQCKLDFLFSALALPRFVTACNSGGGGGEQNKQKKITTTLFLMSAALFYRNMSRSESVFWGATVRQHDVKACATPYSCARRP